MKSLSHLLVALALAWPFIAYSCKCGDTIPAPVPEPTQSAPTVTVPPPPPPPTPLPVPAWEPVQELDGIETVWGEGRPAKAYGGAEILSRETAKAENQPWGIPYPWRLYLSLPDTKMWDCGFFARLEENRWRVGYCTGGTLPGEGRHARRIYLDKKKEKLRIRIGNDVELALSVEE